MTPHVLPAHPLQALKTLARAIRHPSLHAPRSRTLPHSLTHTRSLASPHSRTHTLLFPSLLSLSFPLHHSHYTPPSYYAGASNGAPRFQRDSLDGATQYEIVRDAPTITVRDSAGSYEMPGSGRWVLGKWNMVVAAAKASAPALAGGATSALASTVGAARTRTGSRRVLAVMPSSDWIVSPPHFGWMSIGGGGHRGRGRGRSGGASSAKANEPMLVQRSPPVHPCDLAQLQLKACRTRQCRSVRVGEYSSCMQTFWGADDAPPGHQQRSKRSRRPTAPATTAGTANDDDDDDDDGGGGGGSSTGGRESVIQCRSTPVFHKRPPGVSCRCTACAIARHSPSATAGTGVGTPGG